MSVTQLINSIAHATMDSGFKNFNIDPFDSVIDGNKFCINRLKFYNNGSINEELTNKLPKKVSSADAFELAKTIFDDYITENNLKPTLDFKVELVGYGGFECSYDMETNVMTIHQPSWKYANVMQLVKLIKL